MKMIAPGAVPVFSSRIAWNVTADGEVVAPFTLFHSTISRSRTPSAFTASGAA
ncbi:MAG: hypothetical protein L0Y71_25985 [Gemmataceae bacterium]|nr:hypothetical protein [Gemmataceae bacterium]